MIVSSGYTEAEALGLFRGPGCPAFCKSPTRYKELARKAKTVLA